MQCDEVEFGETANGKSLESREERSCERVIRERKSVSDLGNYSEIGRLY